MEWNSLYLPVPYNNAIDELHYHNINDYELILSMCPGKQSLW